VSTQYKSHPDYSDGYWDAIERQPRAKTTPEYTEGYDNAVRAREMLTGSGFTDDGGGKFSITTTIEKKP
jgi:hypothetical protein